MSSTANNPTNNMLINAIDQFLNPKKTASGIIRVSHGAQFSNGGAIGGWFFMLFLLLIAVILIIQGLFLFSIPIFLFCPFIVAYIMAFQGIEIDINNGKLRNYSSFLGYRSGVWYYLKNFNHIKIYQESFTESRIMESGANYSSYTARDTHYFYTLYLINGEHDRFIKLYENESVTRVKSLAIKFSKVAQLDYIEKIDRK